ncbi:hypothetical protein [Nocardia sp. NPDC049149]|uniref:hypothetical protein n=1 Tax=Nocardia sp. NPDC049149 TaxID=3364315 RepID=UPI003714734A
MPSKDMHAEIDRLGRECGCGTGTVVAALAGLGYPLTLLAGLAPPGSGSILGMIVGGVAAVLSGGLVGKGLGIGYARYRRTRLIRHRRRAGSAERFGWA